MSEEMYSVEQVAERLGLHVRTVRSYIRGGRLRAVRIGKQYRIARSDLDALTGQKPTPRPAPDRAVEVSSIVQIDGVDRAAADRLGHPRAGQGEQQRRDQPPRCACRPSTTTNGTA